MKGVCVGGGRAVEECVLMERVGAWRERALACGLLGPDAATDVRGAQLREQEMAVWCGVGVSQSRGGWRGFVYTFAK